MQTGSNSANPSESLDPLSGHSAPLMQAESSQHSKFGQPVVSDEAAVLQEGADDRPLTPAQAAVRFQIPEHLLRKACSEGRLKHLRVINGLWLAPAAVASFALSWRATKRRDS